MDVFSTPEFYPFAIIKIFIFWLNPATHLFRECKNRLDILLQQVQEIIQFYVQIFTDYFTNQSFRNVLKN